MSFQAPPGGASAVVGVIVAAIAIAVTLPFVYRARLASRITHTTHTADSAQSYVKSLPKRDKENKGPPVPAEVLDDPSKFRIHHDSAFLTVPASALPQNLTPQQTLIAYLRHNMIRFSGLPVPTYLLYVGTPTELRHTFVKWYIDELEFKDGDVVNGVMLATKNEPLGDAGWRIVLSTVDGDYDGILDLTMTTSEGKNKDGADDAVVKFQTETWQWAAKDSNVSLSLEPKFSQWIHEWVTWWLIDKGTSHLLGLRKQEIADEKGETSTAGQAWHQGLLNDEHIDPE